MIVGVGIQTHDDVALGHADSDVHAVRYNTVRIVYQMNIGILLGVVAYNTPGGIAAEPINEKDLQILFVIVLINNGMQAVLYVFFFIIYGYDYGKHGV